MNIKNISLRDNSVIFVISTLFFLLFVRKYFYDQNNFIEIILVIILLYKSLAHIINQNKIGDKLNKIILITTISFIPSLLLGLISLSFGNVDLISYFKELSYIAIYFLTLSIVFFNPNAILKNKNKINIFYFIRGINYSFLIFAIVQSFISPSAFINTGLVNFNPTVFGSVYDILRPSLLFSQTGQAAQFTLFLYFLTRYLYQRVKKNKIDIVLNFILLLIIGGRMTIVAAFIYEFLQLIKNLNLNIKIKKFNLFISSIFIILIFSLTFIFGAYLLDFFSLRVFSIFPDVFSRMYIFIIEPFLSNFKFIDYKYGFYSEYLSEYYFYQYEGSISRYLLETGILGMIIRIFPYLSTIFLLIKKLSFNFLLNPLLFFMLFSIFISSNIHDLFGNWINYICFGVSSGIILSDYFLQRQLNAS